MGNQNSVLLEASCTGNLRKVQQALEGAKVSDVNCKGEVTLTCKLLAVQITLLLLTCLCCGTPVRIRRHHLRFTRSTTLHILSFTSVLHSPVKVGKLSMLLKLSAVTVRVLHNVTNTCHKHHVAMSAGCLDALALCCLQWSFVNHRDAASARCRCKRHRKGADPLL